jgi:predicted secreted protein
MFDDKRSKKVIFVSHCLLNQNAISDGTADLQSQFNEVLDIIMDHKVGIIQLPCPELLCLGLDRKDPNGSKRELMHENTRIRGLLSEPEHRRTLQSKALEVAMQIEEYRNHGFKVLGLIGVNRSPSCGIETTSIENKELPSKGVFMELLSETLASKGIELKMTGVKTSKKEESGQKVRQLLE